MKECSMLRQMFWISDADWTVWELLKQFTVIAVLYETPDPSGKNVVPLTGGVQFWINGVIVTPAVKFDVWPGQIVVGDAVEVNIGVVETCTIRLSEFEFVHPEGSVIVKFAEYAPPVVNVYVAAEPDAVCPFPKFQV